jgi:hypothetical protein
MKSVATAVVVCVAAVLMGADQAKPDPKALVVAVLDQFKFETTPAPGGGVIVAGAQNYRVTQKTIDELTKMMRENKLITVKNDGSVEIK